MMKNKLLLLLLFPFFLSAQKVIEVSEDYAAILVFPSEIDESILGNEQEFLIKEKLNQSSVGLRTLQIGYIKVEKIEKSTNLTVFTKDGNSFTFLLKYAKTPKKLDPYYIETKNTNNIANVVVNKERPIAKSPVSYYSEGNVTADNSSPKSKIEDLENLYITDKITYINTLCKSTNNNEKKIYKTFNKSSNIKLTLKEISYSKDELYFYFSLENKGGQTFDVDFINTKLARGFKGVSTDQSIPLTPLVIYNKPKRVPGNSLHNFIIVFEKFSINDKKELQIDLAEKEGERDLLLRINNKLINNPNKLEK